jgi:hypothetical protein
MRENQMIVTGLKYAKSYPRLINVGSGSQYINNRISVDGNSEYVNIFVSWSKADGKILGNTIDYASIHGRPILLDNGSRRWEVADNDIRVTSRNTGDNTVYVIRIRSDVSSGSSDHNIHHNTIDASGSSKVHLIEMGGGDFTNQNNRISYNKLIGPTRPIQYYNNTNSDTQFFCNDIEHNSSSGYPVYVYGTSHSNTSFDHNRITTERSDGNKVFFSQEQTNSDSWMFCESDVENSDIAGQTSSNAVVIRGTLCSVGVSQCYVNAGVRAGSITGLPAVPNPPTGLVAN